MTRKVRANGLTQQQENFCLRYVEHGVASRAYREAYNVRKDGLWVRKEAGRLIARDDVRARIAVLLKQAESSALYTLEQCLAMARDTYETARKAGDAAGMNGATKLISQLSGHLIERKLSVSKTYADASTAELRERQKELERELRNLQNGGNSSGATGDREDHPRSGGAAGESKALH